VRNTGVAFGAGFTVHSDLAILNELRYPLMQLVTSDKYTSRVGNCVMYTEGVWNGGYGVLGVDLPQCRSWYVEIPQYSQAALNEMQGKPRDQSSLQPFWAADNSHFRT
jgi:hypothetical protein